MNSSRKRSATAAFGSPEDLLVEREERRCSAEDDPDNDVQPARKLISKIQSVELLQKLIQFMPQTYSPGSAVAQSNVVSAENGDIGDIKILSQFKLRYLCRRFRNLVHMGTPLTANLVSYPNVAGGMPRASIADRSGVRLSRDRNDDQFSGLANSTLKTLPVGVDNVHLDLNYSSPTLDRPNPSVASILTRYSPAIQQPVRLSLNLYGSTAAAVRCFVKDFGVPFQLQFPSITLEKLEHRLDWFSASETDCIAANRDCLKHLLSCSSQSLAELSVDFAVLSSALAARVNAAGSQNGVDENATNLCVVSLPTDWSCDGLRTLKLQDKFELLEDTDYDYADANLRAAAHAEFGKLRRWFPNITKLCVAADRPQIDFAVLNEFTELRVFSLVTRASSDELRADCNLVPLTNIECFSLDSTARLPLHFSVVLPNLRKLKLAPRYAGACAHLTSEIETVAGTLQLLQTFIVQQPLNLFHASTPSLRDLVRLIRSLGRLPSLTRLAVRCVDPELENFDLWCTAGDLSLVQVLPKTLTHVAIHYALRPLGAARDRNRNPAWSLRYSPLAPQSGEYSYKEWLRAVLFLIIEHPALEHFYCLCVAPQFEAIFALAEMWNRSSAAAIADLGLAAVVHIQCKPAYTRMCETGIPNLGDRFKFRFVVSPPTLSAGAAGASTKRKFVTVEFHNPNN